MAEEVKQIMQLADDGCPHVTDEAVSVKAEPIVMFGPDTLWLLNESGEVIGKVDPDGRVIGGSD